MFKNYVSVSQLRTNIVISGLSAFIFLTRSIKGSYDKQSDVVKGPDAIIISKLSKQNIQNKKKKL